MLEYSSCLFATVVLHAYHRQTVAYHHAFLALTVTSILYHSLHHPVVRVLDKIMAHGTYALVLLDTPKALADNAGWLLAFPLAAACAWFGQSCLWERRETLHLALHLFGVCGMHVYLAVLY